MESRGRCGGIPVWESRTGSGGSEAPDAQRSRSRSGQGWVKSRDDGLESGGSDTEEGTGTRTGADGSQGMESGVEVGGVAKCNGSRSQDRGGVTDPELDRDRGSGLEEVRGPGSEVVSEFQEPESEVGVAWI